MMGHLRIAARQLLHNRGFTAAVVATLGLGIGANTAVFSLVNDVLLRTLPVKNPWRARPLSQHRRPGRTPLARRREQRIDRSATGRSASTSFSFFTLTRFRDHHPALSDVFAYAPINQVSVVIGGDAETIPLGQLVSGGYYDGLGVSAIAGRTLSPADDTPASAPVAMISYRYWTSRFRRDPATIGRTIYVNNVAVTLIGVTPAGFMGAMQIGESADITLPLRYTCGCCQSGPRPGRAVRLVTSIMGCLAPGVTAQQAAATLEPLFQQTAREGWLAGRALIP